MERRLAAILAADMVGYSRLMAADEAGTIRRQKALREAIIDPRIAKFGGRIVKTTGDGVLVEFGSVVDAVQCAAEVQREVVEREAEVPDDLRITYRIGINLGDIVVDGDDILGDGVNVAARLESVSAPGGICVSDMVYQSLLKKLDLGFTDLGELALKNIDRKIRAWQWSTDRSGVDAMLQEARRVALQSSIDKPSIAILPFDNMSNGQDDDYFADGLAEDIITELAREPDLYVIARNSSFVYKDKVKNIKEVGRDLGARYVLEGSVRRAGNRVRLTAQLIDAQTNRHIWAERYDRSLEDVFEVQDELTGAIYSTLLTKLMSVGLEQSVRQKPTDMDAYSHSLRAFGLMYRLTRADIDAAEDSAKMALAADPRYARGHVAMAWAHIHRVFMGQQADPLGRLKQARAEAQKAIETDRNDYWSFGALGGAELWLGNHDRALTALERAVALGPNSADMRALYAVVMNFLDRPEEGLVNIELAVRLNPHHPDWYLLPWSRSLYLLGRHGETLPLLRRLIDSGVETLPGYLQIIANYSALGLVEEARQVVPALMEVSPSFSLTHVPRYTPFKNPQDLNRFVGLLREAGLPE